MDEKQLVPITITSHLMRPELRRFPSVQYVVGLTVGQVLAEHCPELQDDYVCTVTNALQSKRVGLDYQLQVGDHLVVQGYIGSGGAGRMIAMIGVMILAIVASVATKGALAPVMGQMMAGVMGGLAGSVVMVTGGVLVNHLMPVPAPDTSMPDPTYGWAGFQNSLASGIPYPVVAGNVVVAPVGLGYYKECINADEDYSEWIHFLFAVCNGETGTTLTASKCRVGDAPLTSFTDYAFGATSGTATIGASHTTALAKFAKVHHYRPFDKQLFRQGPISGSLLLHFNGLDASTTIVDSGTRNSPWVCVANAALETTDPKFGSASLSCPDATSYIETDDLETIRTLGVGSWTMEFWFKRLATADNGLVFQESETALDTDTMIATKSLFYDNAASELVFQMLRGGKLDYGAGADEYQISWVTAHNLRASYSLSTGVWSDHICVMYHADTKKLGIFIGGVLTASEVRQASEGSLDGLTELVETLGLDVSEFIPYGDLTTDLKDAFTSRIGYSKFFDTSLSDWPVIDPIDLETVVTEIIGNTMIDEFRFTRGLAYSWDGKEEDEDGNPASFTPPSSELADLDEEEDLFTITTDGKCDSVIVQFQFPALYDSNKSGMHHAGVRFELGYKQVDAANWTIYDSVVVSAEKTTPVHAQFEIIFPSRDQYIIYPRRVTPPADNNTKMNDSFLQAIDELIDEFLAYPGIQVASVSVKASEKLSGQLNPISFEHTSTSRSVPAFDGTSTESIDISNPSWFQRMAMTCPYVGAKINPTRLVQSEFEDWFDYCDTVVDGYKRCTVSYQAARKGNLYDNAQVMMELTGRAKIAMRGRQYGVVIDKPWVGTPVYTFSLGNIIKAPGQPIRYGWEYMPKSKMVDAIQVKFFSRKRRDWDDVYTKAPWYNTLTQEPKVQVIECPTIAEKQEAQRLAYFIGQKTWALNRTCWLEVDIAAIPEVENGNVVWIIAPNQEGMFGGNIQVDHSNASTIKIDQSITLPAAYSGAAKMYFRDGNGDTSSYDVVGPWDTATTEVEIDGTVSLSGIEGSADVWGIARPNTDKILWHVMNCNLIEGEKGDRVHYDFIIYDEDRFYHADYGSGAIAI